MSDILCRWLNEELRLSRAVEPKTFANDFSSGYLIGEVLHKYQLQNDFSMFMKKDTSIAKLNNFTRLEPTLRLLGISFDINTAQDLIQEKQGAATRLLYQLYVSLEKKKPEISGTIMDKMQPAASASLHKKEHELSDVAKRDTEQKLQKICQHFGERSQQLKDRTVVNYPIQQKRLLKVQDERRMKNYDKLQGYRQKHSDATYNQAGNVQAPKPPPYTSQLSLKKRQQQLQRNEQQAQMVQAEIAQFETNRKKMATSGFASSSSGKPFPPDFPFGCSGQGSEVPGRGTKLILQSNIKYIREIRQRVEENAVAYGQREKRRHRFLAEQLQAHEAQEEARREEQLVKRLTRQTRQEQRLVAQLLQMRMEKEVIQENHLFREQQYQQRRERDFQEALDREAALAQQAKLDRAEEIRKELELSNRIAAEQVQCKYNKHLKNCKDILDQIVDLATKMGEYRLLTGNLIPEKQMREWKELLFSGLPLYELVKGHQPQLESSTSLDPVELKKQEILNNQDYDEYTNMVGEWAWPEEAGEISSPLTNNNILGHIIQRMRTILHPPIMAPSSHLFPHPTIKACVLGKFCAGKTSCLTKISEALGICVLSADTLVEEALNAYKNGEERREEVTEEQREKDNQQLLSSLIDLKSDLDTQEESKGSYAKLSTRALQGAAADKELRKGNSISNELLVNIIVEAIRQVPAQSGWILDGFPLDITQAHLLEKALGGSVDVRKEDVNSRTDLAVDPNPTKPPPPPPLAPVLDLALLLDLPDEQLVTRAFHQTDTVATTSQTTDKNLHVAQIPHRITAFQETWPELQKWFGKKQNILVRVDADVDEEELYSRVESILKHVMEKPQKALGTPGAEDVVPDNEIAPDSSPTTPVPVDHPPALTDKDHVPTQSSPSLKEEKVQSALSHSRSSTHSSRGQSENVQSSSVSNKDSQKVAKNKPESAASVPGSPSNVYVDEPLLPEITEYLCPYWDAVCDSYVRNVKLVMEQLRSLRTAINHHLFNIREGYKHYLRRPDMKQELVTQWQKDFNSIPDDMREDEDTKAELYLRLDGLRERLWGISYKRKEENQQERASLMSDGWLEDLTSVLINHHSVLMQVELNRFQETLCVVRVCYLSMYRQMLPEPPSKFIYIPLLDTPGIKDQVERTYPPHTSVSSQMDDGEDKEIHFTPLPSCLKSSGRANTDPVKQHEKLIYDYEGAIKAINELMSAEFHQRETKKQEKVEEENVSESENKETTDVPSPPPSPSPAPPDDKTPENTHDQKVKKLHNEYAAAMSHEENAAKVRIALVKGHGLVMARSLQSRAEQSFSTMQEWFQARYAADMKSISQLSEVVCHYIENGTKLKNELVLEGSDFYINEDCCMVADLFPSQCPLPLEKCTHSTTSIAQQLCNAAPSGLMCSSEFFSFLTDIISVIMSRNAIPEPWMEKDAAQLMQIASLLTDDCELIDWRQFLLNAALPWPFPSLAQLLDALQHFKAADTGGTGYINEEQYLQTELWFSRDRDQISPEDPSQSVSYDRLRKFFFQVFADHTVSPPQLDYASMLQYFAADSSPRQGFIRALSLVLGQHLKHSSLDHLVKSMPSMEEGTELMSIELDGGYEEEDSLCPSISGLEEQRVSIPALLAVICHKGTKMKDNNFRSLYCQSQEEHTEHLVHIFKELGYSPEDQVPFSILLQHPFIHVLMENSTQYQLIDTCVLLAHQDEGEANTLTVC